MKFSHLIMLESVCTEFKIGKIACLNRFFTMLLAQLSFAIILMTDNWKGRQT